MKNPTIKNFLKGMNYTASTCRAKTTRNAGENRNYYCGRPGVLPNVKERLSKTNTNKGSK